MINGENPKNKWIYHVISQRTGVGPNGMVRGWQSMLVNLFNQLADFFLPSKIITFHHLTPGEKQIFQQITERIKVPETACGLYLPPSVRNQMLYTNHGLNIPASEEVPSDDGVLLFSRLSSHDTILNVLLAHPPCTPAIDVYDHGALLAGYVYDSIDDCLESISRVLSTYLSQT